MKLVADTDVLVEVERRGGKLADVLGIVTDAGVTDVALASITASEMLAGAYRRDFKKVPGLQVVSPSKGDAV